MKKVSFGRCNLPHYGHVAFINGLDFFVLSDAKKNTATELRLDLLKSLGCDISKIVVGNPYTVLKSLRESHCDEECCDFLILVEEENVHLPKVLGFKYEVVSREKNSSISSTELRKMSEEDFSRYYGDCEELVEKAKACRTTKKYSQS